MSSNDDFGSDIQSETPSPENEIQTDYSMDQPTTIKGGGGLTVAVIIIILIAAGLAYFFAQKKGGMEKVAGVSKVLPQESVVFFQVDFANVKDPALKREEIWKDLKENKDFQQKIASFEKENGINIEQDLLSWMGDQISVSMLGMPSPGAAPGKAGSEHMAIVIAIKDMQKAQAKLPELKSKSKAKYSEEKYNNETIFKPDKPNYPVVSIVKNNLIIAGSLDDIKKCIDASAGKIKNLTENEQFKAILKELPENPIAVSFVDLAKVMTADQGKKMPNPEMDKVAKALKGLGFGIAENEGNLIGKGFLGIDKASDSPIIKAFFEKKPELGSPETMKLFPKESAYYVATDIKFIYNLMMKAAEAQPNGKQQLDANKQQFKAQMGIDIDKDIIDNLAGEVAYSINLTEMLAQQKEQKGRINRMQPPPILVAIKLKDKAKIQKVVDTLIGKFGKALKKAEYKGIPVYSFPGESGGIAIYENYFLLGVGRGVKTIDTVIDNKMDESKSIASVQGYDKVKEKLGSNTLALAMARIDSILPFVEEQMKKTGMAPGGEKQETAKGLMNIAKDYAAVWSNYEITDSGIKFNLMALKNTESKK